MLERDYIFEARGHDYQLRPLGGIRDHLVNSQFSAVEISNTSNKEVTIPARAAMGTLKEFQEQGCNRVSPEMVNLATRESTQWSHGGLAPLKAGMQERILANGITLYGSPKAQQALEELVADYP